MRPDISIAACRVRHRWFEPHRVRVIELNGTAIGVFVAELSDDHVYVSRIEAGPVVAPSTPDL